MNYTEASEQQKELMLKVAAELDAVLLKLSPYSESLAKQQAVIKIQESMDWINRVVVNTVVKEEINNKNEEEISHPQEEVIVSPVIEESV